MNSFCKRIFASAGITEEEFLLREKNKFAPENRPCEHPHGCDFRDAIGLPKGQKFIRFNFKDVQKHQRHASKWWHRDKAGGSDEAFQSFTTACNILKYPLTRDRYIEHVEDATRVADEDGVEKNVMWWRLTNETFIQHNYKDIRWDQGLVCGSDVRIIGIEKNPELNGMVGVVEKWFREEHRWQVWVDEIKNRLKFKSENLQELKMEASGTTDSAQHGEENDAIEIEDEPMICHVFLDASLSMNSEMSGTTRMKTANKVFRDMFTRFRMIETSIHLIGENPDPAAEAALVAKSFADYAERTKKSIEEKLKETKEHFEARVQAAANEEEADIFARHLKEVEEKFEAIVASLGHPAEYLQMSIKELRQAKEKFEAKARAAASDEEAQSIAGQVKEIEQAEAQALASLARLKPAESHQTSRHIFSLNPIEELTDEEDQIVNMWSQAACRSTYLWEYIKEQTEAFTESSHEIIIITDGIDNASQDPFCGICGFNELMKQMEGKRIRISLLLIGNDLPEKDASQYRDLCSATGGIYHQLNPTGSGDSIDAALTDARQNFVAPLGLPDAEREWLALEQRLEYQAMLEDGKANQFPWQINAKGQLSLTDGSYQPSCSENDGTPPMPSTITKNESPSQVLEPAPCVQ